MKITLAILTLMSAASLAACQSDNANSNPNSDNDHQWTMPWEHHVDASQPQINNNKNLQAVALTTPASPH